MDKATVKRYAAYLEIFILFCIAGIILQSTLIKYLKRDYADQFSKHKDNPLSILFASQAGSSSNEVFNTIVTDKSEGVFSEYMSFLKPVFDIFNKLFSKLGGSVNILRNTLSPMRNYFASVAIVYYKYIENFTIGLFYSMHKFRTLMNRTLSGFALMFHTVEHTKNTLSSVGHSSEMRKLFEFGQDAIDVADKALELNLCFEENTLLKLKSDKFVKIKDINLGDVLEDGSIVIEKHHFLNNEELYKYNGVYVTGSHIVNEKDEWKTVKNSINGIKTTICPEYVYCLSTDTAQILINKTLFRDFNESVNEFLNNIVNSVILTELNHGTKKPYDINKISYANKYLGSGFHCDTLIEMDLPTLKSIKNIQVGDKLYGNNKVIGKISLNSKFFKFYDDHTAIVSSNTKTNDNYIWKNIEMADCKEVDYNGECYNLLTEKGVIPVYNNKKIYTDYSESTDTYISQQIEELMLSQ